MTDMAADYITKLSTVRMFVVVLELPMSLRNGQIFVKSVMNVPST